MGNLNGKDETNYENRSAKKTKNLDSALALEECKGKQEAKFVPMGQIRLTSEDVRFLNKAGSSDFTTSVPLPQK